jgi:cobalt/nickel transport system permease protein
VHILDAILEPKVALASSVIAAGGLAFCLGKLRDQLRERTTVLMGSMAAFVFAAQMVNFPLVVLPASGHLLGGVLAAVLLGPWAGAAVIAAVLLVQCFLFGDGGLTALGANFINMGLIGSVGGYAIYSPIRRGIGGQRGILIGAMAAAWFSVILASGAFAVELSAGGKWSSFLNVLGWMTLVHSPIGLGEAFITGMVVRFVLLVRPDLIDDANEVEASVVVRRGSFALASLGIALAVAIFLAPLASEKPDGLEYTGQKLQFLPKAESSKSKIWPLIPDYELPGLSRSKSLSTAAAGVVGTLVVFGVGLVLARSVDLTKRKMVLPGWEGVDADAV